MELGFALSGQATGVPLLCGQGALAGPSEHPYKGNLGQGAPIRGAWEIAGQGSREVVVGQAGWGKVGWSVTHDTAEQNHTTVYFSLRAPAPGPLPTQHLSTETTFESRGEPRAEWMKGCRRRVCQRVKLNGCPMPRPALPTNWGGGVCWPRF